MAEPPRDLADCVRLLSVAERDARARSEEAAGLRVQAYESDRLAAALRSVQAERDAILSSTSWRLTAPLRALAERLARVRAPGRRWVVPDDSAAGAAGAPRRPANARMTETATLPATFPEPCPDESPRISLLLDRLSIGDDTERVALPVALALTIARQASARLRILTRLAPAAPAALDDLLTRHGLVYVSNPAFDWLEPGGNDLGLGVCAGERAVVSHWVNACVAGALFSPRRVIYVIDQAEVSALTGLTGDRRARALFAAPRPTLIFTSAEVLPALYRVGLLAPSEWECPVGVLTLSDQFWSPDWHRAVDRFVHDWLTT